MKKIFLTFLLSVFFFTLPVGCTLPVVAMPNYDFTIASDDLSSQKQSADKNYLLDEDTGVLIIWELWDDMFPDSWVKPPINARAVPVRKSELERSLKIIRSALKKYPSHILESNLERIYLLHELLFSGISAAGTSSLDRVYVCNKGIKRWYTDTYVEQLFHHEFTTILMYNYKDKFNQKDWLKINSKNFQYGTGGVDAIKDSKYSTKFNAECIEKGILSEYGLSDIEEDINTFAEEMFKCDKGFWDIVDKNEKIKNKVKLLIKFYSSLDPIFTEEYFRKISIE